MPAEECVVLPGFTTVWLEQKTGFLLGVMSMLALMTIYSLWKLFSAPSLTSIEGTAKQALPYMGDDDKITVWGLDLMGENPAYKWGVSDFSPYVARVEAFLRLIQQPYTKATSLTCGRRENPRHKIPFCNIYGIMVDDSSSVIEVLKTTTGKNPDALVTEKQRAMGYLIKQLLQGSLYWVLLHHSFNTTEGRNRFKKRTRHKFPIILSTLLANFVFDSQNANLQGSGIGRMCHEDICQKGTCDVQTLSTILGKAHKFMLGTTAPTSVDSDVYAFLVQLFYDDVTKTQPWVTQCKQQHVNLIKFVDRMRKILYPTL